MRVWRPAMTAAALAFISCNHPANEGASMSTPISSYERATPVTPSDSAVLDCEAFYVGTAGNVAIVPKRGGAAVTLAGCLAGHVYPVACARIMATGTTASGLDALA